MSLNKNVDAEAAQIIGDTLYKTLIMGDQGQGGEPVEITINPTERLRNLKPLGWGRNTTTIFRGDGMVEIYGMTPFKEKDNGE